MLAFDEILKVFDCTGGRKIPTCTSRFFLPLAGNNFQGFNCLAGMLPSFSLDSQDELLCSVVVGRHNGTVMCAVVTIHSHCVIHDCCRCIVHAVLQYRRRHGRMELLLLCSDLGEIYRYTSSQTERPKEWNLNTSWNLGDLTRTTGWGPTPTQVALACNGGVKRNGYQNYFDNICKNAN